MLRIQKLVLHKFPHVAPGTVLEFGPGLNVLLGKNGTGKTTLLKLLTRVASLDFEGLEQEGDYKLGCFVDYDKYSLELLVESEQVVDAVPLEGDPGRAMDELLARSYTYHRWHYDGLIRTRIGGTVVSFSNGSHVNAATMPQVVPRADQTIPSLTARLATELWGYFYRAEPVAGQLAASVAAAEDAFFALYEASFQALAGRFDEALLTYDSFSGVAPSADARTPGSTSLIRFSSRSNVYSLPSFVPIAFEQALAQEDFDAPGAAVSLDLRYVSGLAEFLTTADLRAATVEIDKPEEIGSDKRRRRAYTNFKLRVTLDPQTTVYSNRLSFGQKRLFAFYWYLACIPEGVVLADELVNGFHHDWIAASLDQIGDRQAILASQNPLLLDFLTFDDAEQVRRSFVLCNLEDKEDGGRQWNWHNMSAERASEFFRAYEVGLQHVSEILRVGGWW